MPIRPVFAVVSLLLTGVVIVAAQQKPPHTVFRGGIELVVVDATVLDKQGLPVVDLTAGDFSVTVAGKKRSIVDSRFVASGRTARTGTQAPANAAAFQGPAVDFSSVIPATDTRSIIVAVDVETIRSGEGRIGMQNLADYFDTLPESDLIGVTTLPAPARLELTADKKIVRSLLTNLSGSAQHMRICLPTMGEAAADSVGDPRGSAAYVDRKISLGCPSTPNTSNNDQTRREMRMAIDEFRTKLRLMFSNLSSLANALQDRPGRRAVILVSEGLFGDEETLHDLAKLSVALERARVELFAIHLDFPLAEASSPMASSLSRRLDDSYGFDAMADAAIAGGGAAIRAISRTTPAITRIDAALSGFYVLAFERLESDKDGKQLSLKIEVNRRGVDLRARRHVTINPSGR